MRGFLPDYELRAVKRLSEATAILHAEPGVWRPFSGGTDLMVLFEAGQLAHKKFINLWGLNELRGIKVAANEIILGALTTYREIQAHPVIQKEFPMLALAARETGALAIQNRGTLGGNIANASPAADSPPALLAYLSDLELTSQSGRRWLPYHEFHTGYKKSVLRPDEVISRIRLPRTTKGLVQFYRKVGTRKAQAISKTCFAGVARIKKNTIIEMRIGLGSVGPTPIRLPKTEQLLLGQKLSAADLISRAKESVKTEITPIDDIRSTARYRLTVTANLIEQFINLIRD